MNGLRTNVDRSGNVVNGDGNNMNGGVNTIRSANSRNREISWARVSTADPFTLERNMKYVTPGTGLKESARTSLFLLSVNPTPSKFLTKKIAR